MQRIPLATVQHWNKTGTGALPVAIGTTCPHCTQRVLLSPQGWTQDAARRAWSASASCPGCQNVTFFWAIWAVEPSRHPEALFMYPPAKEQFAHKALPNDVPEPLQRSFFATVQSLNSGNYHATAVTARRTLEGIFKYRVEPAHRKQTLYKLINMVTETSNLAEPLRALSHALRDGGNLGAHFDEEQEPTAEIAEQMVSLLDYLIDFLYVLPAQITVLEKSLSKAPPDPDESAEGDGSSGESKDGEQS